MKHKWKTLEELDVVVNDTKTEIKRRREELHKLESYLDILNIEKIKLCNRDLIIGDIKLRDEAEKGGHSFTSKRHLPLVPNKQISESDGVLPRSSTSSHINLHSTQSLKLTNHRTVSCSMENLLTIHNKSKSDNNIPEKRFSTIDLSFIKKITNYTKSSKNARKSLYMPTPLDSSPDDTVLSESFNSLNTSTEELEDCTSKSDEVKSSTNLSEGTGRSESYKTRLHRNKAIYTKKKKNIVKKRDVILGDNVSLISDETSLEDLSENISLSDEEIEQEESSLGSTTSSSLKAEKGHKKNKFYTVGLSRSKSSIYNREEDSASLCSIDCEEKLMAIERFLALEKAYVDKLQILVENYERRLREHSKDSLTLRHNINTVFHHPCHFLMIHKSFLIAAQHRLQKQGTIPILFGDLFLEMVNQFKVYAEYAADFQFIMETLSSIQSQYSHTKDLMDTIEQDVKISLPDLFHVPLRQVETYQHTIMNVRQYMPSNNSETIILEEADYKLEEITKTIDQIMSEMRKRSKSYIKRELIYKGMMAGQNEKAVLKMRYIFLYNDVLICARMPKTSNVTSLYVPKWYLPLSDILLPLTHGASRVPDTILLKQVKVRIKELQRLIKEEEAGAVTDVNKGAVSKRMKGFKKQRIKVLRESLRDKIEEYRIMHMRLPLKIISKRGKTYTMHVQTVEERDVWLSQMQSQLNKVPACTVNISLTHAEVENMLQRYTSLRKNSGLVNRLDVDTEDETLYDGVLLVQVICGSDLGDLGSKPDVYCTLEADCNGVMSKKNKTKVIKGTTNPIWDETLCIQAMACQFLRIHVYGKKQFQRPTEIGAKLLTLSKLEEGKQLDNNKPHALVVALQPKGQIKITIQLLSQEMARLRKESQHQTFGVSLSELALIEGQKIPPIIHCCFREIETRGLVEEGIYRVCGVLGEIRRLKSAFDECSRNGEILAAEADIHVVAGVVKQFFRELPKPLFPVEMYTDFIQLLESEDEGDKDKMMNAFGDIPEPNISVIVRLIQHLQYIAEYQTKNRMNIDNLALLFGPNVVKPPSYPADNDISCQNIQSLNMQQVNVLKFFCEKPLCLLKELHGDEESLRPCSAPAIFSPTSQRAVPGIARHVSISDLSSTDPIAEEDYAFGLYSPLDEDHLDRDPLTDIIDTFLTSPPLSPLLSPSDSPISRTASPLLSPSDSPISRTASPSYSPISRTVSPLPSPSYSPIARTVSPLSPTVTVRIDSPSPTMDKHPDNELSNGGRPNDYSEHNSNSDSFSTKNNFHLSRDQGPIDNVFEVPEVLPSPKATTPALTLPPGTVSITEELRDVKLSGTTINSSIQI